jgi:citrate lyase subunit beta / citryl-CoA lyase
MPAAHPGWILPLFVPASRPDRFKRAALSGADAIIVDLEDSVAIEDKEAARANVEAASGLGVDVILRINAFGTPWHNGDLAAARLDAVSAVMLPKAERASDLTSVGVAIGGKPLIALIETSAAVTSIAAISSAVGVAQLAFGTQDLAAELCCSPRSRLFDSIRLQLLLAAYRAGIAPPLDGVSLELLDEQDLRDEASEIAATGFAGRLLIHPDQVTPTVKGLCPSQADITSAQQVVASSGAATRVEGRMVDRPVRLRAERMLARASRLSVLKRAL